MAGAAPGRVLTGVAAGRAVALGLAYYALSRLGLQFLDTSTGVTPLWPASGLALTVFLLSPRSRWPGLVAAVFAGNLIAELQQRGADGLAPALAGVNALEPLLAALALRWGSGRTGVSLRTVRDVWGLALAAVGANAVTASLGAGAVALSRGGAYGPAILTWWLADGVGMLMVAPVALALVRPRAGVATGLEGWAAIGCAAAVAAVIFGAGESHSISFLRFPIFLVPLLLWGAVRAGSRAVGLMLLLVCAIAAWGTLAGYGPFADPAMSTRDQIVVLQAFLAVVILSTLCVAAVVDSRHRVEGELHRAIAEVQSTLRLHRSVLATAHHAYVAIDAAGVITAWNPAAEQMFGFSAGEAIGVPMALLIIPKEYRDAHAAGLRHFLRTGEGPVLGHRLELTALRSDGGEFPVELTIAATRAETGTAFHAFVADISSRVSGQRALEHERRQLDDAQAIAHVGSWSWERGSDHTEWSSEMYRIFARDPALGPVGSRDFLAFVHPDERDRVTTDYAHAFAAGASFELEYRIVVGEGEIGYVHVIGRHDGDGCYVGTVQDVTGARRAEQGLREAEERFRGAFEEAPIGMALVDTDGGWVRVNRRLCEMVGYTESELLALSFHDITHPEDLVADLRYVEQVVAGEIDTYQMEKRYFHKDGSVVWANLSVSLVRDEAGAPLHFVSQIEDVTERKRIEAALRASEARYQSISDNVPGMVYRCALSTDGTYSLTFASDGARELYGVSPQELMADPTIAIGAIHPEDAPGFARSVAQSAERLEQWEWRGRHVTADGGVRYLHGTSRPHREPDGTIVWDGVMLDETEVRAAQEREASTRRQLQLILENLPDAAVTVYDADLRLVFCEGPLFAGLEASRMIGHRLPEFVRQPVMAQLAPGLTAALEGRASSTVLEHVRDGRALAVGFAPYRLEDGRIDGALVHWRDISVLRAAQAEAQRAQERFRRAFDHAPIGIALVAPDGRIEQANEALAAISERTRSELEGAQLTALMHPSDRAHGAQVLELLSGSDSDALSVELRFIRATGTPVDVSLHAAALRDGEEVTHLLCQFQDVTERKRYEAQLQFMADHDPLTGLMNRRKFEAELDRHIAHVKRYGPEGALIALDIDHFKQVNDTLGHNAGDQLIISIAGALRGRLRESDILARLGGDEFAILLPRADVAEATRVAESILVVVRDTATLLDGGHKRVTVSTGVTMFTAATELSGDAILVEADLAMYDAKEAGRDRYAFYATSGHQFSRTKARLAWVDRIQHALDNDRFALVAQPILDLRTNRVRQHELLIRMRDERDELIPPATFLYIAERFGLMSRIDEWVIRHAIELLEAHPDIQLEVNISGRSLGNPQLLDAIEHRLRHSVINPARLILEVTETAAVANISQAQTFAQRLRDLGCRFALDDFGAGFGSFYYLKHLPFDYVKIDGEFVQHVVSGQIDRLVIEAVVRIAQGLGKETIAEFVTDEKTQRMVARLGVDHAQGYHIGKPMPVGDLFGTTPSLTTT